MPQYRVIQIVTNDFEGGKKTEEPIWQGEDIDALSRKHPPSEIFGADSLKHNEFEDGWIRNDFRFERQLEDGTWEECPDPRRRLSHGRSDLEREVEAENRRLFPGDYIDEYSDPCYDYHDDDYYDDDDY